MPRFLSMGAVQTTSATTGMSHPCYTGLIRIKTESLSAPPCPLMKKGTVPINIFIMLWGVWVMAMHRRVSIPLSKISSAKGEPLHIPAPYMKNTLGLQRPGMRPERKQWAPSALKPSLLLPGKKQIIFFLLARKTMKKRFLTCLRNIIPPAKYKRLFRIQNLTGKIK